MSEQAPAPDRSTAQLAAAAQISLRLLSGTVPPATLTRMQEVVRDAPDGFPLGALVKLLGEAEVSPHGLLQQATRAQREWILRGGRRERTPVVRHRGKTMLAKMLGQLLMVGATVLATVAVLVALRHHRPDLDVYRLQDWLHATFPQFFPGR